MPIAMLGGTFDPVHRGHLAIAQAALEDSRFRLERIVFIPADIPPHKQQQTVTPYEDRFAMLQLALRDYPRFGLSRIEGPAETKGEPNYSINTIRRFRHEHHLSLEELYFIVGIDSFVNFSQWREPEALMSECRIIVAQRPGLEEEMMKALVLSCAHKNISLLETVSVDVSSTQIRAAIASGEPLDKYVLPQVADYINKHHLYG